MDGDAWLSIVIGASGIIAIAAVALVVRSIRPAIAAPSRGGGSSVPPRSGADSERTESWAASTRTSSRAWGFRCFGPWRRHRSVERNLERAFARIDAVDPYELPRRIGGALSDAGLLDEAPDEPAAERPRSAWPFGQERGRQHGKDEE